MITYAGGDEDGRYFYHFDALGSVVALSQYNSGNGYASIVEQYQYSAFGETTVTQNGNTGNPYRFTGRQWDGETGLYYYRARMYSPTLGRFLQTDPIGYADGMNLYAYCGNNPLNLIDPWGLCLEKSFAARQAEKYGVSEETYIQAWYEVVAITGMWATGTGSDKITLSGNYAFIEMMKNHPDVQIAREKGSYFSRFSPTPSGIRNMINDWYHPRHLLGSFNITSTPNKSGGRTITIENPHTMESAMRIFYYASYSYNTGSNYLFRKFFFDWNLTDLDYSRSTFRFGGHVDQTITWQEE